VPATSAHTAVPDGELSCAKLGSGISAAVGAAVAAGGGVGVAAWVGLATATVAVCPPAGLGDVAGVAVHPTGRRESSESKIARRIIS